MKLKSMVLCEPGLSIGVTGRIGLVITAQLGENGKDSENGDHGENSVKFVTVELVSDFPRLDLTALGFFALSTPIS